LGDFSRTHLVTLDLIHLQKRSRVARLYIFKPKIPIWVFFGGLWESQCWYTLWPFGIFNNCLVCFVAIRYIFWSFGEFYPSFRMLYQDKSGNPDYHSPLFAGTIVTNLIITTVTCQHRQPLVVGWFWNSRSKIETAVCYR
jgi:hypothetical protein